MDLVNDLGEKFSLCEFEPLLNRMTHIMLYISAVHIQFLKITDEDAMLVVLNYLDSIAEIGYESYIKKLKL